MSEIKLVLPERYGIGNFPELGMSFLNGGEIMVSRRFGGYVVASGCGSGKTTIIKDIIKRLNSFGILYSASTIKECNEMYQYCKTILPEEDIVMFHSSYQDEGVNNNLLRNNDEDLGNRKVIICTHHKLLNESPEILLKYHKNIVYKKSLSYLKRGGISFDDNGVKRYPRQFILIDELPTCNNLSVKINKQILRLLGVQRTEKRYDEESKSEYYVPIIPIKYDSCKSYDIIEELYRINSSNKDFKFFSGDSESVKFKTNILLSMIYDNYESYMNMEDEELTITYNITDQLFDFMETRYIIFDGTGDLTFKNSEKLEVLTFDNKYSSDINLTKIEFGLKRNYRQKEFSKKIENVFDNINSSIDTLSEILSSNKRTLIVTWKNFKINEIESESNFLNLIDSKYNGEFKFTEYIRWRLENLGYIKDTNFNVIHYQSGLDKATNEFRDYDSIVFLGEFHVPNDVIEKFNMDYRTNTTEENYSLYQLAQAVCRTRIRNHKGESISIYYTEDWKDEIMVKLVNYLSGNNINSKIEISDKTLSFIKPKWIPIVKLLGDLDPNLINAIERKKGYKLEFTLDEIWNLIPMDRKKIDRYYPMINYFRKLGVDIKIMTTWGNNQYTK